MLILRKDLSHHGLLASRLALLSTFINVLDEDIDGLVIKFVDDTKLEGIANMSDSRIATQKRPGRLEQWSTSNKITRG
jgi:hypothetical protein